MLATIAWAAHGNSTLYAIPTWRRPLTDKYKNNRSIVDLLSFNNIKNDKNNNGFRLTPLPAAAQSTAADCGSAAG